MEFSTLDTITGAEKGAFLHLKHPALGHKMYTGKGANPDGTKVDGAKDVQKVGVTVLGRDAETVKGMAEKLADLRGNPDSDPEEVKKASKDFVCAMVVEFHGLTKDSKPMQPTNENKRVFFDQSDDLVEQVIRFAMNRANFWSAASVE